MNTAASVARLMGFSDERVEDLKTAVAEACINAIEHGNKLDEGFDRRRDSFHRPRLAGSESHRHRAAGPQSVTAAPDIDKKMHGEEDAPRHGNVF